MASQRVRYNWASNICGRVRSTLSTKKLFAGVLDRSENWISLVHSFGKDKIFGYLLGYSGLSWWLRWERICPQSRRPRFDPSVGKISWRREWQPNPVFLPGKSHGQRSQACSSPWGHKKSDMTEWLTLSHSSGLHEGRFSINRLWHLSSLPLPAPWGRWWIFASWEFLTKNWACAELLLLLSSWGQVWSQGPLSC